MKSGLLSAVQVENNSIQQGQKPLLRRLLARIVFVVAIPVLLLAMLSWVFVDGLTTSLNEKIAAKNQFDIATLLLNKNISSFKNSRVAFDRAFEAVLEENQAMMYSGDFAMVTQVFASMNVLRDVLQQLYQDTLSLHNHMQDIISIGQEGKYIASLHGLYQQVEHLNRRIYKFGWQFDQLVTSSASTINMVRVGKYQRGVDNYLSTGRLHRESLMKTAKRISLTMDSLVTAIDANSLSALTTSSHQLAQDVELGLLGMMNWLAVVLVGIIGVGVSYVFLCFTKPMAFLVCAMQRVSSGDLGVKVKSSGRKDTIGDMERALGATVKNNLLIAEHYKQLLRESDKMKRALLSGEAIVLNDVDQPEIDIDNQQLLSEAACADVQQQQNFWRAGAEFTWASPKHI
ncbi:MAG: hypothetical protein KTR20_07890 [Cellvibrionaceae bacterium]|nr:hypothetical protein [Cellvibrionaceae bacterium]